MDITRVNKLIIFIGNNLEPNVNYIVLITSGYKRFKIKGLFIDSIFFRVNNVYNRVIITEFYCQIYTIIMKENYIDILRNIEISFHKS